MKRKKQNPIKLIGMCAALLVLLVLLFLLMRMVLTNRQPQKPESCSPDAGPGEIGTVTPAPTIVDLYAYFDWTETTTIKVYDHRADKLVDMDLEEYIVGVVSAEMPAYYSFEALKAQAVASRTYTLYGVVHGGCHTNPDADVCTNSKCCQAFSSQERMQKTWGKDYAANYNRVAQAVMETAGEVLVYDGKLCDALDPMREENVDFGTDALVELIAAKYPESGIDAENVRNGIAIAKAYDSGRVETLRLGKTTITGKQARNLFGLRSTMFTIEWTQKGIVLHTKGYGHGVGLSQNGANGMAKHGSDYREILLYYYTGAELASYGADGIQPLATPTPGNTDTAFVPEG